jgi:hypothetical protein
MPHMLDFKSLPRIESCRVFMQLDQDAALGIKTFQRLFERASNAVRFAYWSMGSAETLRCPESEAKQLREGCFRAALTEFASMEEVQQLDYKEHGLARKPLKLNATSSPLLHLFRELRNLEVHLRHSEFQKVSKDFLWGQKVRPSEASPVTISIWTLDGVTPESFGLLNNGKIRSNRADDFLVQLQSINVGGTRDFPSGR